MKNLIKIIFITLIFICSQYSKAQEIEKYLVIAENTANSLMKAGESNQNYNLTDFDNSIKDLDSELKLYKSDIDNIEPLTPFSGKNKMLKLYSSVIEKRNAIVTSVNNYNEGRNTRILKEIDKENALQELKKKKSDSIATIEKENRIKLDSIKKLEEKNKLEVALKVKHINDSIQNSIDIANGIRLKKYLSSQEWKSTELKVKKLESDNYVIAVQIEKAVRSTVKGYTIFGDAIQEVPDGLYANLKIKASIIRKNEDTISNISNSVYNKYGKELYEISTSTDAEIEKAFYASGIASKFSN